MLRRLLNIASIVCVVLCVALMGMWVRSYRITDEFAVPLPGGCGVAGQLFEGLSQFSLALPTAGVRHRWHWHTEPVVADETEESSPVEGFWKSKGFYFDSSWPSFYDLMLPYWFLVLTTGTLAMAFQLRWPLRFTLRSLFIVTTFLAVVLGMIAWLDRAWIGK
jgi:hypothetical protein